MKIYSILGLFSLFFLNVAEEVATATGVEVVPDTQEPPIVIDAAAAEQ